MTIHCIKVSVNNCHFFITSINCVIIYKCGVIFKIYVSVLSNDKLHDNWNMIRVIILKKKKTIIDMTIVFLCLIIHIIIIVQMIQLC